eukprot:TRINITY_DN3251_c0_g1_i1.p1 TRINITY_DN3251_c0_g1~~TRINITY_DN3251_c0_g1_i1.p1  ORF type:complete len:236 (+),score=60.54 TRINITY_DN3251_c0_g1_i1:27-710(+)
MANWGKGGWDDVAVDKFQNDEEDDGEGLLGSDVEDWENWEQEEEEAPKDEGGESKPVVRAEKAPPKPRVKKTELKKKAKATEVDAETQARRAEFMRRVQDFNNATELFGDMDNRRVPVAELKPKSKEDYASFCTAVTDVITTFSRKPAYADFLVAVLRNVKGLKLEEVQEITRKASVLHAERVKEEKNPAYAAKKKWQAKKDDMDAGLDMRAKPGGHNSTRDDYDFM